MYLKNSTLESDKESGCHSVTWLKESTNSWNPPKRCYLKKAYCENAVNVSTDPALYNQYPGLTSAFKQQGIAKT